jgi:hypothetical protein
VAFARVKLKKTTNDTLLVATPATLNAPALSAAFEILPVVYRLRRLNDGNLTIR